MSSPVSYQDYEGGVTAIDAQYVQPGHCAVHLLVEGTKAAVVDTGTNASAPIVVEVLKRKGLTPEDVAYVIVTHVHLDHAGGAGEMMRLFPNATLVVHPRGARHMADPSRLVAGAAEVYGPEEVERLYGTILPVPAERIVEAEDGLTLSLNGRPLLFQDAPGHAKHHLFLWDAASGSAFTGDAFGISFPAFQVAGRSFVMPTTSPVQFDPPAAHATVNRVLGLNPRHVFVTHYSRVGDPAYAGATMHSLLDSFVALAERVDGEPGRQELLLDGVRKILWDALRAHGWKPDAEQLERWLGIDIQLNAQGLEVWLDAKRKDGR